MNFSQTQQDLAKEAREHGTPNFFTWKTPPL